MGGERGFVWRPFVDPVAKRLFIVWSVLPFRPPQPIRQRKSRILDMQDPAMPFAR